MNAIARHPCLAKLGRSLALHATLNAVHEAIGAVERIPSTDRTAGPKARAIVALRELKDGLNVELLQAAEVEA